jgi:uncharacterized protein (TIGR01777 family)
MRVLIAGGTGLVGKALLEVLKPKGWEIGLLTRQKGNTHSGIRTFSWNPQLQEFDEELKMWPADAIVNLAGENVGKGAWTEERKKAIRDSRIWALETLAALVQTWGTYPKVISMSASGYYGQVDGRRRVGEDYPAGRGFLADVCVAWEGKVHERFSDPRFRLVVFRLGVVLDPHEGALPQMLRPIRFAFGQPLGSGFQIIPWIHRQDVAKSLLFALEHPEISGIFNLAAPTPVTNATFMKTLCEVNRCFYIPVPVPAPVLRLFLGEQADLVLQGVALDVSRWMEVGFKFQFEELRVALEDLILNSVD